MLHLHSNPHHFTPAARRPDISSLWLLAIVILPIVAAAPFSPASHTEADLLTSTHQLVFEGRRSGEGYFSSDSRYMIFQSERVAGNPFFQEFLLDLMTGDTRQLSSGVGKTTCGWIHPGGRKVLFASTHEDPEARAKMTKELTDRTNATARRYEWQFDDRYEIYESPIGGGEFKNLTQSPGYDAEGSWSPDGTKIAFASNRIAYTQPMSAEDKKAFDQDNGYMADIYIMDADGSNVRRLTESKGYDGGPFFSPDGRRIVWRRFNLAGDKAEIWTMTVDGSDKRQITGMNALSWAPYYHPSGDYIIFSTNRHGMQNFELYIVDAAGMKEPVRVTFTDGPDVLPVFTPDGKKLSWVTRRGIEGSGQIFVADWNDGMARKLLALAPVPDQTSYRTGGGSPAADMSSTSTEIRAEDARLYVTKLASPAMEGRLTGTPGEAMATDYVAKVFASVGLIPAGDDGFYQPFRFTSGVQLDGTNVLSIKLKDGTEFEPAIDKEWRPLAFSKTGSIGFADLVFAGYGMNVPVSGSQSAYDSYGDLDVKDKWVVVLRYQPENVTPERRQYLSPYANLRFKAIEARDREAAGMLVVSGPTSQARDQLVPLRYDGTVAGAPIPAASINDALAAKLFAAAGRDLVEVQKQLDDGKPLPGFPLPGAQAGAHFTLKLQEATGRSVIGRLQVGAQPSRQIVVLGAHVDHLGRGEGANSLAKPEERGQIHFGADDNASGIAGLLEIAQNLSAGVAEGGLKTLRRDLVFAAWSGEELGLLGSNHFVKMLKNSTGQSTIYPTVSAYLNMDMIGRLQEKLILQGSGSSPFWKPDIERRNVPIGLHIGLSDDAFLPTDATSFYVVGVPILAAFTGAHGDYHTPRDTSDKLDYENLARIAKLVALIAEDVSAAAEPPAYMQMQQKGTGPSRRTGRAYLGTIPDYAESDIIGVKLQGVSAGSPAAKAGVEGGDILVELAGQSITNIYDFTKVLDGLKIGQEVGMAVTRAGRRLELKVTPAARE